MIGESYNLPAAAVALRPVEAAAPARCTRRRLSVAWVYHEASSRASQPVWMGSPGRQRNVSLVAFVNTRSGDGAKAARMCRCVNDAGCAQAIVRPGEDCRRLKQCLMTPGTHGIFQC